MESKKKEVKKIHIFKAQRAELQGYINNKFKNYTDVQGIIGIIPI